MMSQTIVHVIEIINDAFCIIFTLEAIFKIYAMRTKYFKDNWNNFDFTVVVLTAIILGLKFAHIGKDLGVTSTILRSLRIGRVFRLIKRAQELQAIF